MIDEKNKKILEVLKRNARLDIKQIARKTGIPITTVFNRIKEMEKSGVIESYKTIVNKRKLGNDIQAFIQITTAYNPHFSQDEFSKRMFSLPEVEECYIMSGATSILIKVSVPDIDKLNDFIIQNLRSMRGIEKIDTHIIFKTLL